jgi:hypothetical protein
VNAEGSNLSNSDAAFLAQSNRSTMILCKIYPFLISFTDFFLSGVLKERKIIILPIIYLTTGS